MQISLLQCTIYSAEYNTIRQVGVVALLWCLFSKPNELQCVLG